MRQLGRNIRRRREFLGFTEAGLAEHASVPLWYLQDLERDAIEHPDIRAIERIGRSLETDGHVLLTAGEEWLPSKRRLVALPGGARRRGGASLVATADWPWRLVAATRIKYLLARACGDHEEIEFWGGALSIAIALLRKEAVA